MNNQETNNSSIIFLPEPVTDNQQQDNSISCKLILNRRKAVIASAVKLDVEIDGVKVGELKNGGTLELNISAGYHTIYFYKKSIFVNFIPNNKINFLIKGDTTADVVVLGANSVGITNINGQGDTAIYQ